jgi:hypothetical protein
VKFDLRLDIPCWTLGVQILPGEKSHLAPKIGLHASTVQGREAIHAEMVVKNVIAQVGRTKASSDVPLEKLLNLKKTAAAAATADGKSEFWKPELSKEGAVSFVLSSADKSVEVIRNGVVIGKSAVTFTDPAAKLPHAIFLRLAPEAGKDLPHWVTVDVRQGRFGGECG